MRRSLRVVIAACAFLWGIVIESMGQDSIRPSGEMKKAQQEPVELSQGELPRPMVRQKYPNTAGIDIVTDAPWRVVRKPNSWIPVLIFVPDANLPDRGFPWDRNFFRGFKFTRITIYEGMQTLYEDTDNAQPTQGKDLTAVDENGSVIVSDLAGGENLCQDEPKVHCDVPKPGGWHRIIRIPLSQFGAKDTVFLKTEIVAEAVYNRPTQTEPYLFSRTLKVEIGNPFPSLGPNWKYFDVHMHTIAEWSMGEQLLAPRKAFGGPVQMIKDVAWVMGLTPSLQEFKDHVIATDHNTFFSDAFVIGVGPTGGHRPELKRDKTRFKEEKGQVEFENMRDIFGMTFGEEVTLQTSFSADRVNFGSHLLLMRANHREGPWHGGLLSYKIFRVFGGEENKNSLENVLTDAAQRAAFAYAAHPFAIGNHWNNTEQSEQYLEMLHSRSRKFTTPERKFILKGGQYWNEKNTAEISAEIGKVGNRVRNVDFFDLHPFVGAPATPLPKESYFELKDSYPRFVSNPNWDSELHEGLIDWHSRIRRLLRFSFGDAPDEVFPRKLYLVGGSDAHGDFNYTSSLLATILDNQLLQPFGLSRRKVTSNAFAMVRTYVNAADKPGATLAEQAVNALADGNAVVTDGPVLTFSSDADLRFDSTRLVWRENFVPVADLKGRIGDDQGFNEDGRIGGDGRYDGAWTALVVKGSKHGALKYRWNNTSEFGPAFGGRPEELHLYLDEPDKPLGFVGEERRMLRPFRSFKLDQVPADRDVVLHLDMEELHFETPLALSLAIFARKSSGENFRCYTNPVWFVPVEITAMPEKFGSKLPRKSLTVTFSFGMSMMQYPYEVRLVPLNERGESSGPGMLLSPDETFGKDGWDTRLNAGVKIKNAIYRVTNSADEVDPGLSKYDGKFAIYLKSPQDIHGNVLNSVGTTIILGKK